MFVISRLLLFPTGVQCRYHVEPTIKSPGKLSGGYAGMATGLAFATEYQSEATPHAHGFVSLVNMYQHHTLEEIGQIIEHNRRGIQPQDMLDRVIHFVEHLQREDHFNNERHQRDLPKLEKEFHANNAGLPESLHLSVKPQFMYSSPDAPYMWADVSDPRTAKGNEDADWQQAFNEADSYRRLYEEDVQFVFSRVQHHWHALNEKGDRVPLKYCRLKGRSSRCSCKAGHPKKVIRDRHGKMKEEKYRARVVCQTVARELGLKTSGRRNALGSIAGRRRCEWFAQTSAILAGVARSNTNVQCNYRVPITKFTHDPDCTSSSCTGRASLRRLCLITQRAMKQLTGYFGGYISKRQKVGQFELKKSIAALNPLHAKLESRNLRSASAQLAHVCNRMFVILEGKGILRASTEECMLASRYKPNDPLAAEFIRTFRERNFHGRFFVDRYDALKVEGVKKTKVRLRMPSHRSSVELPDEVAFYGYRPTHSTMFYLSPWEFCQWFFPQKLRAPSAHYEFSKWTSQGKQKIKESDGQKLRLEPYEDYVLDEDMINTDSLVFVYPPSKELFVGAVPDKYERFRNSWLLIRRQHPMIPCPQQTPLPSKRMSKWNRAKIFSVYLRPWTLSKKISTLVVPYLADLDKVGQAHEHMDICTDQETPVKPENSIRRSWKQYVCSALPHATRQMGVSGFELSVGFGVSGLGFRVLGRGFRVSG